MTRKEALEKGGMLAGAAALALLELSPRSARAATSGAALGVHAGNVQWGWSGSLDNYSSPVNRKPSLINVFQAFYYNGGLRHVSLSGLNTLQNRYPGSVIMLTLEPRGGPVTLDSIRTYAVERERLVAEVSIGSENISSKPSRNHTVAVFVNGLGFLHTCPDTTPPGATPASPLHANHPSA